MNNNLILISQTVHKIKVKKLLKVIEGEEDPKVVKIKRNKLMVNSLQINRIKIRLSKRNRRNQAKVDQKVLKTKGKIFLMTK